MTEQRFGKELERALLSHAKYFDGLLELIPSQHYLPPDDTESPWVRPEGRKRKAGKLGKGGQSAGKAHAGKPVKVDPNADSTVVHRKRLKQTIDGAMEPVEDHMKFGQFSFKSSVPSSGEVHQKGKKMSKQKLLEVAVQKKEAMKHLPAPVVQDAKWGAAFGKAEGIKQYDNPTLLRKSIKKDEARKKKSAQKWEERMVSQQKGHEERQQNRKANIQKRREGRKTKGKKKKKARPGFEGRSAKR